MSLLSFEITHIDEKKLPLVAAQISRSLPAHCWVGVKGDLGSGKTTLLRHILQNYGFSGAVKSPTYALVNEYCWTPGKAVAEAAEIRVVHMDWYRLSQQDDLEQLGLLNYSDPYQQYSKNICYVEWYELFPDAVAWDLHIHITYVDSATEQKRNYQFLTSNFELFQTLSQNLKISK